MRLRRPRLERILLPLLLAGCGGGAGSGGGSGPELVVFSQTGAFVSIVDRVSRAGEATHLDATPGGGATLFANAGFAGVLPRSYVFSADGTWIVLIDSDASGREDLVAIRGNERRVLTAGLLPTDLILDRVGAWSDFGTSIAFLWRQPAETFPRLWIADPTTGSLASPFSVAGSPLEFWFGDWSPARAAFAISWRPGLTGGWRGGIVDAAGVTELLPPGVATDHCSAAFSPDGSRVAWLVPISTGEQRIYVTDVPVPGTPAVIPAGPIATIPTDASIEGPIWSPDGSRLAWYSDEGMPQGVWQLVAIPAGGGAETIAGPAELFSSVLERGVLWTPDSTRLLYQRESAFGGIDVVSTIAATGARTTIASTPSNRTISQKLEPSPDGSRIAFLDAVESGSDTSDYRLRILNPDGTDEDLLGLGSDVTSAFFLWAPDGEHLGLRVYRSGTGSVRVVSSIAEPRTPELPFSNYGRCDWSGDGAWFVVPEATGILGIRPGDDGLRTLHTLDDGAVEQLGVR